MASTVWRGFITFGLISIPIRLFRAARPERISFRKLYREEPRTGPEQPRRGLILADDRSQVGAAQLTAKRPSAEPAGKPVPISDARPAPEPVLRPVQQVAVQKETGQVVPQKSVVKGYEYEKDRFVVVDPEELKSIAPKTATEMEIQEFVRLDEIDPVYFETSYYVVPEEAGEKAYALLFRALQASGLVAIAKFAMHQREHVIVLRPGKTGIISHTMYFTAEVRADEEFRADTKAVNAKELELAQTLIHSLAAPFEPEKYHDTYREKLESILASKVEGRPAAKVEVTKPAEVVDIAEALRKSLANLKKPASSDQELRSAEPSPKRSAPKKAMRGAGRK